MQSVRILIFSVIVTSLAAMNIQAAGTVAGSIKFEGTPPKAKKIKMDADPVCAEMHADAPMVSQEVVVNDNGTLRNVFVYVKDGLGDQTFETPTEHVTLEQKGCTYHPRVFGMQAKQPLDIVNSDETLHNIHALPTQSKEFNVGQPNKGMKTTRTFATPEVMVKLKCDVHPWMAAYVGVLSHPFYSVSGEDGKFTIKNLPTGTYEIAAWHEKYGEQTKKVTVAEGESKTIDFTFKAE